MELNNNNIESENLQNKGSISSLTQEQATGSNAIEIPQISLPKGGGAIKGIDEKFEVNAANGTANLSLALPWSPGRNGFTPSLGLSYNSGGSNSPFGLGWSLGIASISRKTEKGLPGYRGGEEDTFMFTGVEDLIPFLKETSPGDWEPEEKTDGDYRVKRYRPRIEGGFSRIEKITHPGHGTYWKVTTGNNIATIFGRSTTARIADPEDEKRIFRWLAEFSYDDKGNWIKYTYKPEDLENVPQALYEENRHKGIARFTNQYLKSVRYGNKKPYYADPARPYDPSDPVTIPGTEEEEHFFELILDYGEHHRDIPETTAAPDQKWSYRADAFSAYRSGFEIRTNRLCKRILMFHKFEELSATPYLVKSLDLEYEASSINNSGQSEVTYLKFATQTGYIRKEDHSYSKKSLPPIEYTCQNLNWDTTIKKIDSKNIANAPVGLTNNYQWVDLYGEGINGILTEQAEGWFYKENLGPDGYQNDNGSAQFTIAKKIATKPSFTGLNDGTMVIRDLVANGERQAVIDAPNMQGYFELHPDSKSEERFKSFRSIPNINWTDPNTRMIDLNGDGQPDLVVSEENAFVWYPAKGKEGYDEAAFANKVFDENKGPAIVFADQEQTIFLADMCGDGLTDIVRIRNGEICYWANKGYGRFSAKINMSNAPKFDHPDQYNPSYLYLADVSGTGATDILYLGKNKFKAFINHSGNAWSDAHEISPFTEINNRGRLSVTDLLGTGTSCIVWSTDLPGQAPMQYIDLMSSKKPHIIISYKNNFGKEVHFEYKSSTHYYLKDKKEGNPWITKLPFPVQVVSKLIVEEKITDVRFTSDYCYHHGYYDHPEREFRGFGMVEQTDSEHYEEWSRNNATNQLERSEALYQAPARTKTWFHTGAFLDREQILTHFKSEYWHEKYNRQFPETPLDITEPELPDARLSDAIKALAGDQYREALRACKGMMLRQEIFALDAPVNPTEDALKLQMKPYTVATHNCNIQLLQPGAVNEYGVFLVTESEAITLHYERDETDYRIAHTLNTRIDDLGNILESASVVYGRQQAKADADFQSLSDTITDFSEDVLNNNAAQKTPLQNAFNNNIRTAKDQQTKTHIIYTHNNFAKYNDGITDFDDIDLPHAYRLRLPHETKTYELTGFSPADDLFKLAELENALSDASEIGYHETATGGMQSRLIEHLKTRYSDDDLNALDFGCFDTLALPYENYQLAYTPQLVTDIYTRQDGTALQADGDVVSNIIEIKGKYANIDGNLWIRSGIVHFKEYAGEAMANIRARFFSPIAFEDPFGALTSVVYDTESFTGTIRNNDGYYLFIKETTNAVDNKMQVDVFNYRTLSPSRMIDLNANPTSVILDELGLVKALAIEGNGDFTDATRTAVHILQPADSLSGIKEYTETVETDQITQLMGAATSNSTDTGQLRQAGNNLLQEASVRFIYDFDTYKNTGDQPVVVASIIREEHFADNNASAIQFRFEYSNGLGNIAMAKVQAEPGMAYYMEDGTREEKDTGSDLRWAGTGRTVLNNKGNPVKQYEPYFSTSFLYENAPELVETGVTPILYYDSIGRLIKTVFPDGTLSRMEFDSWKQINSDRNDTILESDWYHNRINNLIDEELITQGKDPAKENQAARKAAAHAHTPSSLYLDSLGRPVLSVAHNGKDAVGKDKLYTAFIALDIEGNTKAVKDARDNTVMAYKYDMLGHRVWQNSMDAGERWILNNLMGNPVHHWDSRNHVFSYTYDTLQRPESIKVSGGDGTTALDHIYARTVYGEGQANEYQYNLRGQVVQHYDTAGRVQNIKFDFKGNTLETTREFNTDYKNIPDWILANLDNTALFDADLNTYTTQMEYDALNRVVNTITPDSSETKAVFNEAGLLEQVRVTQTGVAEKIFVKNIDYDAKGQRERIVYGDSNGNNLATTTYQYDNDTFRLLHLSTVKPGGDLLQDLYYTYDPVGNISEIEDKAIPTRFFNNFRIEPKGLYQYDALYRLIEAQGKEHAGQAVSFGLCDNWKDNAFLKTYSPGNDMAWRNYTQRYHYDPVGNILETNHNAVRGNWTRVYEYEPHTNRLTQTQVGAQTYLYPHHPQHGFITALPHLHIMEWNFKDELQAVAAQAVCHDSNAPETTYYVYDSNGQRVRKLTENQGGTGKKEERLYLSGIEIYKKHSGNHSGLERTTLHIMDDTHRIAMIDTRNDVNDDTDPRTVRFQLSNHLGSASLELDDTGNIISYEEYHPFGTTAYQAKNAAIRAAAKRYRYTGMERDGESGLEYHSARYYLPWLGRWISNDPIYIEGGVNLFQYSYNNPIKYYDPNGKCPLGDPPDPPTPQQAAQVAPAATQAAPAAAEAARAARAAEAARAARAARAAEAARAAQAARAAEAARAAQAARVARAAQAARAASVAAPAVPAAGAAAGPYIIVGVVGVVFAASGIAAIWRQITLSASLTRYGNPYSMPREDIAFPQQQAVRDLSSPLSTGSGTSTTEDTDDDDPRRRRVRERYIMDANVLIEASRGNPRALSYFQRGDVYITRRAWEEFERHAEPQELSVMRAFHRLGTFHIFSNRTQDAIRSRAGYGEAVARVQGLNFNPPASRTDAEVVATARVLNMVYLGERRIYSAMQNPGLLGMLGVRAENIF